MLKLRSSQQWLEDSQHRLGFCPQINICHMATYLIRTFLVLHIFKCGRYVQYVLLMLYNLILESKHPSPKEAWTWPMETLRITRLRNRNPIGINFNSRSGNADGSDCAAGQSSSKSVPNECQACSSSWLDTLNRKDHDIPTRIILQCFPSKKKYGISCRRICSPSSDRATWL